MALISELSVEAFELTTGSSMTCLVTLTEPAPTGGITLLVDTDNLLVTTPASITINEGGVVGSFDITADADIPTDTTFNVAVRYKEQVQRVRMMSKTATLESFSISPNPCRGGSTVSVQITLTLPAPANGAKVYLSQLSDTAASILYLLPPYVTIPENQLTYLFNTPVRRINSTQGTNVTATYKGGTLSTYLKVLK